MSALMDIDRASWAGGGRTPQLVHHHLADHPLLTVEALAVLADRMDPATVEHNVAKGIDVVMPDGGGARVLEQSPGEVARTIETNDSWMVLKHIERDPAYKALLDATLDEVGPFLPGGAQAMLNRQGFIFLSAPESITPAHVDFEHNILCQIRGSKEFNLGRFESPEAEQLEMERANGPSHRNMEYAPIWDEKHDLRPGDGLYVPVGKPHWIQNGPVVSVSLSITWRSEEGLRAERVHALNDRLRRLGLSPRPPGERVAVDQGKAFTQRVIDKARAVAGRG